VRRLVVVTGTGTEIGKTHTTCALLHASQGRAVGLKPIESGALGDEGDDGRALRLASPMFHVKPSPYLFRKPVSPHLAAREEGRTVDLSVVARFLESAPDGADLIFLELPGGLFSLLAPGVCNADLAERVEPHALLLVAPDRLGVLHDVGATMRALAGTRLRATAIALVAPARPDASTGTNAAELATAGGPSVFPIARAPAGDLGRSEPVRALYAALLGARVT
jgi:dethiobiotin synthetase